MDAGQLYFIVLHITSGIVLSEFNLMLPQSVRVSRERNNFWLET